MSIGIYKITNKKDNKVYIGQSQNIERRLSEHKKERFIPIDMWINFLGKENFDFEIIEECSLDELDKKEKYYINYFQSNKTGYNKQEGGNNNSVGEGNGSSILKEEDVKKIRHAYQQHTSPKQFYKENFKDKISYAQFQGVWAGRSWSYIMPEVFTEENKNFYRKELSKQKITISKEDLLKYRKYYINHTQRQTYQLFVKERGELIKESTFSKILIGDVRENSSYKEVPIYSKKRKCWELNGEAVQTILGTEE